jgi:glutaredoxin 1
MITIYGKANCGFCTKAKDTASKHGLEWEYKDVGLSAFMEELLERSEVKPKSVPQIWIDGTYVGGYNEFVRYLEETSYNGTGWSL